MRIHVVRPGESVSSIARQYGVTSQKVISDNELENPNQLVVGQTLVIMEGTRRHTVSPGETLYYIALQYGLSVNQILAANPQIPSNFIIFAGQVIIIPPMTINFGTTEVNGYAFPGINREVLGKTLPHLTYLSIFSYQANADGSLDTISDEPLIQAARAARTAPLMVVTNSRFNSDVAHTILTNAAAQNNLVNNITRTLREKNYYGLNIDFEYVYPNDRQSYNNFLSRLVCTLRPLGYPVITALAPKLSAGQRGLQYEAHDYPAHGALADKVILMTYEWGFTYGPPMAVAPVNEVRKVLDYAVTAIPRQKILMGIPNYGYDWTLPYKHGTAARTISNVGAVELAWTVRAAIQFDRTAQAPFFNYYDNTGAQHVVWFEDARSILAKFFLANEFRVDGLSYWTIGSYFPQNWLILSSVYNVRKLL